MTTTHVSAEQKKWVGIECESCGTRYACLVQAMGTADDSLIWYSKDTLKELALYDLDLKLQKRAAANPCPKCGIYPECHVERTRKFAKGMMVFGLAVVVFIIISFLLVKLAPDLPGWTILIVLAASIAVPYFFCKPLVDIFDPNSNLEQNKKIAGFKIANGIMRITEEKAQ